MLSCPLPSLYRHRFSHREKWPAFQLRRLQMRYTLKKQKYRKLQSLIVSCSCSKQAVGRYPSFHILGEYKGTSWRSSSFWMLRQDQAAIRAVLVTLLVLVFAQQVAVCRVLGGCPAQVWSVCALILCFILSFYSFVFSLLDKLRRLVGLHHLSPN